MDHYLVSARKYRPSTFASVVGQKALAATLKNAVATGRLAHSYLFCGSRGVGKTSCARIFAKAINCEHPSEAGEPCNDCPSCRAFNAGASMNIIELDAASNNGVDAMRELVEMTQNPPSTGRYRVFIVDEVHMLSTQAFNAFLKTLEEPPSYVVFILATTEKQKILPTILSRCQTYDFARITIQDMVDHLAYVAKQEGMEAEPAALGVIARKADGAMRDALSIFDQVAACSMGHITYRAAIESLNVLDSSYYVRLLDCFLNCRVLDAWLIYKEIRDKGFDSHFFINGLASFFRDLMAAQSRATLPLIEADEEERAMLAAEAAKCHPLLIHRAMALLGEADLNYRQATNKQFLTELTLAKICQLSSPSPNDGSHGEGQAIALQPITPAGSAPAATNPQTTPSAPSAAAPPARPQQPSQQPSQQPLQTPAQPAPATPKPREARGMGGMFGGARINHRPGAAAPPSETAQAPRQQQRSESYTAEDLARAWQEAMAKRPTEQILVHSMRLSPPAPTAEGPHIYNMCVENDAQMEIVSAAMPRIMQELRQSLRNDAVTIRLSLNQGEASPVVWSEREVFAHMREHYPELDNFIKDFHLIPG